MRHAILGSCSLTRDQGEGAGMFCCRPLEYGGCEPKRQVRIEAETIQQASREFSHVWDAWNATGPESEVDKQPVYVE